VSVTINYSTINAAFTFNQDNATDCYELSFTNSSTSTGGANITLYDWDFGFVGGDSNTANPTIIFPQAGTYTVSLDITNSFGCTHNITQNITVQGANPALDLIGNNFPLTLVSDLGDTCVFGFCVFGNNTNYVLSLNENSFVNYPGASISNVTVTDEQTGLVLSPPVQITYPAAETGYAYFTVEVTDNLGCTTTKVFAIYKSNLQNLQYS